MRINLITDNNYNQNFGAKLSYEVNDGFEFLGVKINGLYGKESEGYSSFQKDMATIRTFCPKYKILEIKTNDKLKRPYFDLVIKRRGNEPHYMGFNVYDNEDLYTPDTLSVLATYIKERDYEDLVEKNNKNQRKQQNISFFSKIKNLFK